MAAHLFEISIQPVYFHNIIHFSTWRSVLRLFKVSVVVFPRTEQYSACS